MADSYARCSDEDLLLRLRNGERDVFGTLVRRYERELYGYLKRYLGKADLAEDVFQNTFVAVFRKIRQYEPGRAARPWLYTIATHQAIDAMRQRSRRPDYTPQEPGNADDGDDAYDPLDRRKEAIRTRPSGPQKARRPRTCERRCSSCRSCFNKL